MLSFFCLLLLSFWVRGAHPFRVTSWNLGTHVLPGARRCPPPSRTPRRFPPSRAVCRPPQPSPRRIEPFGSWEGPGIDPASLPVLCCFLSGGGGGVFFFLGGGFPRKIKIPKLEGFCLVFLRFVTWCLKWNPIPGG